MVGMEAKVTMPMVQVVEIVDSKPRVMALVVSQEWIVTKQPRMEVEAAVNMAILVKRVIKITIVVMTVAGPHEHVEADCIQINHAIGPIDEPWAS
jgi:hypothetical protein